MQLTLAAEAPRRPIGSVLGETLVGTSLVLLGVWLVCLALTTRTVAVLVEAVAPGADSATIGYLAWAAMLAAPAGLVLLGTDRLARMLATVRSGLWRRRPPDSLAGLPADVSVIKGVRLDDGRPAPTLLLGGFGMAVVRGLPAATRKERRLAAEQDHGSLDPRDAVTRDAERMRRWLSQREVDFVVRVYAAVVSTDESLTRSASCAVVTTEQLPAWIASLPRQRSLTLDRRARLLDWLREAT
jgi:hypothetical protein